MVIVSFFNHSCDRVNVDIENEIRNLNRHMPVSRRTLLNYMESDDDTYKTKDGQICSVDRKEMELLAEKCTEIEKMRLKLPIFISTDISCESGAWKIEGKIEVAVVSKLLDKRVHTEDFLRLYHPDLKELRDMLPSLTVTLFLP